MKPFIRDIILIVIIVFCLDKLFFFSLNIFPAQQYDQRLESILTKKIDADIIILGSSRAARDILAEKIEESIDKSCYNLGDPGSNIDYHQFLLCKLIEADSKPELILLVIDQGLELKNSILSFRMDKLYPLIKYDEINREICRRDSKNILFTKLFLAYRIRENFPMNFFYFKPGFLDILKENGSMPLDGKSSIWTPLGFDYDSVPYTKNGEIELYKELLGDFVNICHKNGIKLLFIYPPNFSSLSYSFAKRIDELTNYSVDSYFYDTNNPVYFNKNYFYNGGHLNTQGAIIFTEEIIKYLQNSEGYPISSVLSLKDSY